MKSSNGISKYLPTIQQLLTIVAAIAALASAFVAYKLAPIYAIASELNYRIGAIEKDYTSKATIDKEFSYINKRLDEEKGDFVRLESKVDKLLVR